MAPTPVLLPGKSMDRGAWWAAVHGVAKSRTRLSDFTFTFLFHALEKEMATHSSILAWRIPGTAEPGGLPSMGSQRVRHDWSDLALALALETAHVSMSKKMPSNLWSIHIMEWPSEIRTDELLIHTMAWINLKNSVLRGREEALRKKYTLNNSGLAKKFVWIFFFHNIFLSNSTYTWKFWKRQN